jgi:transposase
MMGRQVEAAQLFYEFSLERHVPSGHLLRRIDEVLDLSWLRAELASFYSSTGRSSIDPELMIRMLLVGTCYGIRSERRLCDEVHLNLGYRWFCRLGLDGAVPDHSTFSKARHGRFREAEVFRRVFERVVGSCMSAGLVGGEGFAVDASVIEADASYAQRVEGPTLPPERSDPNTATRPVREYLAALDAALAQAGEETADARQPERLAAEPAPAKALSLDLSGRGLDLEGLAQGVLRFCRQHPRGSQARDCGGRGGHARPLVGGGRLHSRDDRAHAPPLRPHALQARRGLGLWVGPAGGLAHGARD